MKSVQISWQDLDKSVLEMNPMEYIMASADWSAAAPDDEPWLATCIPTANDEEYFTLALALDGYHVYSEDIRRSFIAECELIISLCDDDEIQRMKEDEISKGNTGILFDSEIGLLRIHVPSRLLQYAKERLRIMFESADDALVQCTPSY
jgi:hypothetical protein